MASFSKHFQTIRFTGRTFLISAGVLAVVIGLFFIPEIVAFQLALSGKEGEAPRPAEETSYALEPSENKASGAITVEPNRGSTGSPLGKVALLLREDGTTVEQQPPNEQPRPTPDGSGVPGRDGDTATTQESTAAKDSARPVRPAAALFRGLSAQAGSVQNQPLPDGWEPIRGKSSQKAIKSVRAATLKFVDSFSFVNPGIRHAVLNFVSGLDFVLEGAEKTMNAEGAIKYLEELQYTVTRNLIRSGAQRSVLMSWAETSELPFLTKSRTSRVKLGYEPYFFPKVLLSDVDIRQRVRRPNETDDIPVQVRADVAIFSRDVKTVDLYKNEVFVQQFRLSNPDPTGRRVVKITGDARDRYTLVLHDKFGAEPFMKSYTFFPRVRRFRHQRDGRFQITLSGSESEGSLDRFFSTDSKLSSSFDLF